MSPPWSMRIATKKSPSMIIIGLLFRSPTSVMFNVPNVGYPPPICSPVKLPLQLVPLIVLRSCHSSGLRLVQLYKYSPCTESPTLSEASCSQNFGTVRQLVQRVSIINNPVQV